MDKRFTIASLLAKAVSDYKDEIAVVWQKKETLEKYTYGQIYEKISKTAAFFQQLGLGKGSHCLLILENCPQWLISYFALICSGAICVPLNPDLRAKEILNLAKDCQAKKIISSEKIYQEKLKQHREELPSLILVGGVKESEKIVPFEKSESFCQVSSFEPLSSEQAASLIYTSGTTGSPKGVVLTQHNIAANFKSIEKLNLIKRTDNILALLPLYHVYPFMVTLIVPFMSGAKITYFPVSFRKEDLLSVINHAGITILVAIPQFYQKLYLGIWGKISQIPWLVRFLLFFLIKKKVKKEIGKTLRLLVSGGARLDEQVGQGFKKLGFSLVEGYGLTETSPIVALNPINKVKFGSVGKAVPDVSIRIDNPDKAGVGEICVRGPNVMKGYYKRSDLTLEVIKEGWFHTGDLGYLDPDGYLFITGRKKEVIVLSSGKNIYPQDVEAAYLESPYIKEICVMAGEKKENESEFLFAVVVPDMDYYRQKGEADIKGKIRWQIEEISTSLPTYQRIRNFIIVQEDLPKTALGKLERYKVKQEYLGKETLAGQKKKGRTVEQDPEIEDKEKAGLLISFLSKFLKKEVYLDDHLELDLGIDSLGRVELATAIESNFSLQLPEDFFLKIATVKGLILEIAKGRDEGGKKKTSGEWKNILEKEPPGAIKNKLRIKVSWLDILIAYGMKVALFCFFKVFLCLKVKGKPNIPGKKPFIICANHTSYFDGFLIFAANSFKHSSETFFIGYREILELKAFRWGMELARLISIEATTELLNSLRLAAYVLKKGKIICLFPEGERSPSGETRQFKKGIGILLKELEVDVLPVYIEGAFAAWPRGRFLPRPHPVTVNFGRPLNRQELLNRHWHKLDSTQDDYGKISQALKLEIENLKKTG